VLQLTIESAMLRQEAAATRGDELGLTEDEIRFYDALADNESAVRELADETLKKIAHELTENLRQNITVNWSSRESEAAADSQAYSQKVQIPTRPAGCCGGTGFAAGAGAE
jgi:type I site-specific restriction-modification system R (restriction) subunit